MNLKGARAGRFHPRCTRCQGKFELVIDAQGNAQALSMKKGDSAETLTPAIAAALGLEDLAATTPPPANQQSGPMRTAARSQAMQTMPPPSTPVTSNPPVSGVSSMTQTLAPTSAPPPVAPSQTPSNTAPPLDQSFQAESSEAQTLPPSSDEPLPGTRLGGYEVVQKLGQGGMGSVYLARQLSLDRNVALKVLQAQLAADAQFVARFTREAYAAAQLNHHNVVQIHDIGSQRKTHFFSMEYVEGMTLASLVKQQGPLPAEVAAGYILQAARGLKFAHDHGMVHRDVKPDNLLLSRHGIVKVADLGLVKTPTAKGEPLTVASGRSGEWYGEQTQVNVSMGTPAYMAPEQAQDAAHVDARADIYSLGCTLYTLLTGRPPFVGRSVMEIINKHLREPVQPPGLLVEYVPSALSDIVMKMLAKRPEARYQDMDQVIKDLESFLGQETTGPYAPKQEHIKILENCSKWFADASWANIRQIVIRAFFPVCALALVTLFFALPEGRTRIMWLQGVLGFALFTPLNYLIIQGIMQRTHLMLKVRELVFGARLFDWVMWLGGAAIVVWLLVVLEMHWPWLLAALLGAMAAAGFHFTVDPQIAQQRRQPLERIQAMLKQLREKGVSETALQQFICQYAGEQWEELYEQLFGYESKLLARERWNKVEALTRKGKGDPGRPRPKYAAWRDPVLRWIDTKLKNRREARDRRHLEKIELQALVAQGLPETVARKKAKRVAVSLVVKAADLREQAMEALTEPPKPEKTAVPSDQKPTDRQKRGSIDEDQEEQPLRRRKKHALADEGLEDWERLSYFQRRYGGVGGLLLGPSVRFGLGAILLIGAILWVNQNRINPAQQLSEVVGVATDQLPRLTEASAMRTGSAVEQAVRPKTTRPLNIEPIPPLITRWFNGWHVAIAGLLLLVSTFFEGNRLGWFLIPAAAMIFFGPTALEHVQYAGIASIALGLLLGILGLQFARD